LNERPPESVDLGETRLANKEELPRPVPGPDPEFGRDGRVPGDYSELADLLLEITYHLRKRSEDLLSIFYPDKGHRDFRDDGEIF
jgi:hypothetical protein